MPQQPFRPVRDRDESEEREAGAHFIRFAPGERRATDAPGDQCLRAVARANLGGDRGSSAHRDRDERDGGPSSGHLRVKDASPGRTKWIAAEC